MLAEASVQHTEVHMSSGGMLVLAGYIQLLMLTFKVRQDSQKDLEKHDPTALQLWATKHIILVLTLVLA